MRRKIENQMSRAQGLRVRQAPRHLLRPQARPVNRLAATIAATAAAATIAATALAAMIAAAAAAATIAATALAAMIAAAAVAATIAAAAVAATIAAAPVAAAVLVEAIQLEETETRVRVVPDEMTIEGPKATVAGPKPVELLREMVAGTGAIGLETKVLQ